MSIIKAMLDEEVRAMGSHVLKKYRINAAEGDIEERAVGAHPYILDRNYQPEEIEEPPYSPDFLAEFEAYQERVGLNG